MEEKAVIHKENFDKDGNLRSVLKYVDRSKDPPLNKCEMRVPIHYLVLGAVALVAIAIIFIAAMAVIVPAPRPGFYNETCASRSCLSSLNLKCINKTCLCATDEYYSNKCVTKKNYMEKCGGSTDHCKSGYNMVCRDGVCKCIDTNYWNGKKCVSKSTYNQYCSSDSQCLTDLMLTCDTGLKKCLCSSTRFWDGTACPLKRTYNEVCKDAYSCLQSRYLICVNQSCDCNITQYWDTINQQCLTRQKINETCLSPLQCYTPMNCTNYICTCGEFSYHDMNTLTCRPQTLINTTCSIDFNCRGDKGLICKSGLCQCKLNGYKWSFERNTCILAKNYSQSTCTYDSDCYVEKGLICNSGSSCNCPTSSITGMCDCLRNSSMEYFWNGASCQQALTYGSNCTGPSGTYICKWMFEGTVCNGTTGNYTCQCPYLMYFDTTSGICKSQTSINTTCTVTIACRVDLGLICNGGKCVCNSTTQYWNPTSLVCSNYIQYSQSGCTADSHCASTLVCNNVTNTRCNCPLFIDTGYCDCPRAYGSETYWNGQSCVAAVSYNQSCSNSSTSYMCQTMTQNTYCDGGTKTCSCYPSGGFNTVTNRCTYCSSGWNYFNGKCYRFVSGSFQSTSDADTFNNTNIHTACGNVSATLVVIGDLQTLNYINSVISTGEYWVGAKYISPPCPGATVSLTSYASEDGTWVLANNSPFTTWCGTACTKLTGTCCHCVYYNRGSNCFMNDVCNNLRGILCQIS